MKLLRLLLPVLLLLSACGRVHGPVSGSSAEASVLYRQAEKEFRAGNEADGYALMQQALDKYAAIPGSEERQSVCLYWMAIEYHNQRDTVGLQGILGRMKVLLDANPSASSIAHDYYSVLAVQDLARYEEDPADTKARDRMMDAMKMSAAALEAMPDSLIGLNCVEPVWAWYNIAVSYDLYYDPPLRDSIAKYLSKAEQVRVHPGQDERGYLETFISTEDLRAWLRYYDGDYLGAKASMDSVLAVIARVEEMAPNSVITERGEAYAFYVEMYSSLGQYDKALEYQQLLEENNMRRYDVQRLAELHDVSERYQSEKKQAEIERLQTLSRWRLWLILGLAALLGALAFVYLLYRRSAEQKLYEAALEAENRMAQSSAAGLVLSKLKADIAALPVSNPYRSAALGALSRPELGSQADRLFASAEKPLSTMDRKYLYCILAGLRAEQIGGLFNIETDSVYTVRYRLRRKFPKGTLPV